MYGRRSLRVLAVSIVLIFCGRTATVAGSCPSCAPRPVLIRHMYEKYPEQFTDPQKKNRKTFSQFGYNLYEFPVPIFPITKFIRADKFGQQSYGKPHRRLEKNGSVYSCRGGFLDVSHIRAACDWTVYLTLMMLRDRHGFDLPWEAGDLHIWLTDMDQLTNEDVASLAQRIAFERLVWHEVASWHYHKPYHKVGEQQSTFTPEDTYSNMLGAAIGRKVALRMLSDTSDLTYSEIASDEIAKYVSSLQPVNSKEESRWAYDMVDLNKQRKLAPCVRNTDVWYDSRIVFHDERYCFKRYMNIGPDIYPWLVPTSQLLGCPDNITPEVISVPETTQDGHSFNDYYEFRITPDSNMFYDRKHHRQLHPAFGSFITKDYDKIMAQIRTEMAGALGNDLDQRDHADPTGDFHAHKVWLK